MFGMRAAYSKHLWPCKALSRRKQKKIFSLRNAWLQKKEILMEIRARLYFSEIL